MGNLQKLVFLHTQKVLFHTLENNFIPWSLFHTLKTFFIPWNNNFIPLVCFIPWKLFSYLYKDHHHQQFHTLWNFFLLYTVLSFHTSISYPDHGISYQVAKKQLIWVWNEGQGYETSAWRCEKIWQMLWKYDMPINVCFIVIWVCFVPLSMVAHFFCICFIVYSRFVLFSCLSVY